MERIRANIEELVGKTLVLEDVEFGRWEKSEGEVIPMLTLLGKCNGKDFELVTFSKVLIRQMSEEPEETRLATPVVIEKGMTKTGHPFYLFKVASK